VAAYIIRSGWRLVRESVGGLMDEAVPPELEACIRRLVAEHAQGALEAHALRTRRAGPLTFIEFHLVVPGDMTVKAAHEICDRLEGALRAEIKGCRVMIHVEPEGKAERRGMLVL
jgi:divalent metal cation (Fe/Co/Zn/Cd) transporter